MKQNTFYGQLFFEFNEWRECFKSWRDNLKIYGDTMQMVISTNWSTSGYWIEEKGKSLAKGDQKYTGDEVFELEKRVQKEIDKAHKEKRSPSLIL